MISHTIPSHTNISDETLPSPDGGLSPDAVVARVSLPGTPHTDFFSFGRETSIPGHDPETLISSLPASIHLPEQPDAPLSASSVPTASDLAISQSQQVSPQIPAAFNPIGSEVLKALHESGLGIPTTPEPALPSIIHSPGAPDYYFLPRI